MTDREMLELAAKAAGIEAEWKDWGRFDWRDGLPTVLDVVWNPLTDDGDALRLAAKLHLTIWNTGSRIAKVVGPYGLQVEKVSDDYLNSVRHAITHAAAEIGKARQETTS